MIERKLICIAMVILGAVFAASRSAAQQDIGGTAFVDGYGEVEQATYILADSDNQGIDAFTKTENFDFSEEDIEYIGALGILLDNGNVVDSPQPGYDYESAEIPLGANTNVGDTYTVFGQSGACYYDDESEDEDDCDFYTFEGLEYQLTTGLPKITSISPNSVNQGASGTLTVNGQNLVDDFGNSQATVSGSGVTATVQNPDPTQKTSVTVQYSVDAAATVGVRNFGITTNFGASDSGKNFTVGYPPAVITNVSPSIWQAGTSLTATITGTGFGTAPTVSISAPGVSAGTSTVTNGGSSIQVPITVAANAPNEPVSIIVQPGYTGSNFLCGSQCTGNGSGTTTASVQAATPPNPTINFLNGTTASPFAGQAISLYVSPPSHSWAIASQSWSFSNSADIVANYLATSACGAPVPISQTVQTICGTSVPAFSTTQGTLPTFYYIVPGQSETVTVTVTYQLADGSNSPSTSSTQTFSIQGPTGTLFPNAFSTNNDTATAIANANNAAASLQMTNAPGMSSRGVWFNDTATPPQGNFTWVQILTSVSYNQLVSSNSIFSPLNSAVNDLDGIYPYPSLSSNTTADSPSRPLYSNLGEANVAFSATMFSLWDPAIPPTGQANCTTASVDTSTTPYYTAHPSTCASIPVPLGSVNWNWSACAINTGAGPTPLWTTSCGLASEPHQGGASGYPSWNTCYKSAHAACQ